VTKKRKISAIIPVKNQPETLEILLRDLLAQQLPDGWDLEVVVVDNDSSDDTPELIKRFPVIALHEPRLGPSIARNTGAARASGEIFVFIDADAVPASNDFFCKLLNKAEELGQWGGMGGPILLPPWQQNNPIAYADHMACWSAWPAFRPTAPSGFQPTCFIVPAEVFRSVGGYNEEIRVLEDLDLQTRIIDSGRNNSSGDDTDLPMYFVQELGVYHHARSSLWRTIKHSWYWGLPTRDAWLTPVGYRSVFLHKRVLRWLALPRLFLFRLRSPLQVAWRVSKLRTLIGLPFLCLTILVWTAAVIVGKGQPEADRAAPV
jgi:glycosyltransferase involved in cell wall biosynthesis